MKAQDFIQEVPEHKMYDSTKMKAYLTCPRKYFYEYVLGWRPKEPSVHLEFGIAWHLAMEHLNTHGRDFENVKEAFKKFNDHYRKVFPNPESDDLRKNKIPANALRGLAQYVERYMSDSFEVLATEIAGSISVSESRTVYFKTDLLARDDDGKLFVLDYKTAYALNNNWIKQWELDIQVGTYSHLGFCSVSYENEFKGFIIDGFSPRNEPRLKRDGTPYAGSSDNDFLRVKFRKTLDFMNTWLWTVNNILDRIEQNMEDLMSSDEDDHTLETFPMNPNSCISYNSVCPYHDYCTVWNNPLNRISDGHVPAQFKVSHWNPVKENLEQAKKKVEL